MQVTGRSVTCSAGDALRGRARRGFGARMRSVPNRVVTPHSPRLHLLNVPATRHLLSTPLPLARHSKCASRVPANRLLPYALSSLFTTERGGDGQADEFDSALDDFKPADPDAEAARSSMRPQPACEC